MNNEKVNTLVEHLRSDAQESFNMLDHETCIMGEASRLFNKELKGSSTLAKFLDVEDRFDDFRALVACNWGGYMSEKATNAMNEADAQQAADALQAWAGGSDADEAWESVA